MAGRRQRNMRNAVDTSAGLRSSPPPPKPVVRPPTRPSHAVYLSAMPTDRIGDAELDALEGAFLSWVDAALNGKARRSDR